MQFMEYLEIDILVRNRINWSLHQFALSCSWADYICEGKYPRYTSALADPGTGAHRHPPTLTTADLWCFMPHRQNFLNCFAYSLRLNFNHFFYINMAKTCWKMTYTLLPVYAPSPVRSNPGPATVQCVQPNWDVCTTAPPSVLRYILMMISELLRVRFELKSLGSKGFIWGWNPPSGTQYSWSFWVVYNSVKSLEMLHLFGLRHYQFNLNKKGRTVVVRNFKFESPRTIFNQV